MIWSSRVSMSLQLISRKVLHKHRAAQSSRSQWLLYQRLTNANSVGREGGCCRDWLGNSQRLMKVRRKSMESQRKYLVQAGSWGGPCNLIVTEASDFRLKELCAAFAGLMSVVLSSSSVAGTSYISSSLLCINKMLRNGVKISEQLFWF